jgi:hypothetical protein
MKAENHLERLKQNLEILEESIKKGIVERQQIIGFSTSLASAEMLEILLHKKNLIDPGFVVKHEWLKSKNKIKEKFPFDFSRKDKIFELIERIEEKRNILCYGKPQEEELIREVINNFNELRKIFKEEGLNGI